VVSVCAFCGRDAGVFRKEHPECREAYDAGFPKMISLAKDAAVTNRGIDSLEEDLTKIVRSSYLPTGRVRDALVAGWEGAANNALEDNVLSRDEEERLNSFRKHFDFAPEDLNVHGGWTRIVMGAALRDLLEGKIPTRFRTPEHLPFNMHTSETLVWAFEHVKYYEKRTRTTYVGGSEGMSVRMMSGVYFRTSSFRGAPVTTPETVLVDTGLMGITTRHI